MIHPTIGRRVWYWPNGCDGGIPVYDEIQACDAGIAYVWNDRLLNISVADHSGTIHQRTSVKLLQEGDPVPARGQQSYAQWMPYQVSAAKA